MSLVLSFRGNLNHLVAGLRLVITDYYNAVYGGNVSNFSALFFFFLGVGLFFAFCFYLLFLFSCRVLTSF